MSDTLDDLILTEKEPENKNSKSMLGILALVVILLIAGAVLAKMIFDGDANTTKANTEVVAKDVASSSTATASENAAENNMAANNNSDVASINSEDPDLAPLDNNENGVPSNVDTVSIDDAKNAAKKVVHKTVKKVEDKTKDIADDLNVAPVQEVNSNSVEHKVQKKVVHHTKPKVVHHKVAKKHIYGGSGNVYIQVGSFAVGPQESFINKIRRAGFHYRIKTINGLRKVYVGPFESRSQAANILGVVKSRISSQAFIK